MDGNGAPKSVQEDVLKESDGLPDAVASAQPAPQLFSTNPGRAH